jgi:uncharacterized membrane protein SpoIIM required for sporulation
VSDLARFIEERGPRWKRLEELLDATVDAPESALGVERLQQLLRDYRSACLDLNQARRLTANPQILGSLNQLVGRAYRFIYRRRRRSRWPDLRGFWLRDVPATFRSRERPIGIAALCFIAGAVVGFAAVAADPHQAALILPQQFFTESPSRRVARIETGEERIDTMAKATQFGAFLYTHNIQVSFLTFAAGALTLLGGAAMLFYNGVMLGAVAAQYLLDGAGAFLAAWVGPHGALELPSIVFAGAAGFILGRALLLPGENGRAAELREAFPAVLRMLSACALLLVFAGLIEGGFSQLSARAVPYAIKISAGVALFTGMFAWLFIPRRR